MLLLYLSILPNFPLILQDDEVDVVFAKGGSLIAEDDFAWFVNPGNIGILQFQEGGVWIIELCEYAAGADHGPTTYAIRIGKEVKLCWPSVKIV